MDISDFQKIVWDYYVAHSRLLPWRTPILKKQPDTTLDPYAILVSEIMLQQTQVDRVIPKYEAFMQQFPTIESLSKASLGEVLRLWSGLGYNRRAKFVWQAAQQIMQTHGGIFPRDEIALVALPGVGKNTAGAIRAYAFNESAVFVETNIRTVFIYHFFRGQTNVPDSELTYVIERSLPGCVTGALPARNEDIFQVREWYWALMDYGAYLKQTVGNISRLSKHHNVQSKFAGSKRQLRGEILRLLTKKDYSMSEMQDKMKDDRIEVVLHDLHTEQLIQKIGIRYHL